MYKKINTDLLQLLNGEVNCTFTPEMNVDYSNTCEDNYRSHHPQYRSGEEVSKFHCQLSEGFKISQIKIDLIIIPKEWCE